MPTIISKEIDVNGHLATLTVVVDDQFDRNHLPKATCTPNCHLFAQKGLNCREFSAGAGSRSECRAGTALLQNQVGNDGTAMYAHCEMNPLPTTDDRSFWEWLADQG